MAQFKSSKPTVNHGKTRYLNDTNSDSATNVKGRTMISGSMVYEYYCQPLNMDIRKKTV